MPTTTELEKRILDLEAAVTRLERRSSPEEDQPKSVGNNLWVLKVAGQFRDDPHYAEADRLGREWRDSQMPDYSADAAILTKI